LYVACANVLTSEEGAELQQILAVLMERLCVALEEVDELIDQFEIHWHGHGRQQG
jgi:hypothetical protein